MLLHRRQRKTQITHCARPKRETIILKLQIADSFKTTTDFISNVRVNTLAKRFSRNAKDLNENLVWFSSPTASQPLLNIEIHLRLLSQLSQTTCFFVCVIQLINFSRGDSKKTSSESLVIFIVAVTYSILFNDITLKINDKFKKPEKRR